MTIKLDKDSNVPFYKQIYDAIVELIDRGELKNGDCLHPERKLSQSLNVSRGTVRKAYSLLKQAKLVVSQTGGYHYVSGADKRAASREESGRKLVSHMLKDLIDFGLAPLEISRLINLEVVKLIDNAEKVVVGIIECRRDIYYLFENFFSTYPNTVINFFVLDELKSIPELLGQLQTCDMILTTSSHYYEVCTLFPTLEPKITEIITLWTQKTVSEVNAIKPGDTVGVIYADVRTVRLVKSMLKYFNVTLKDIRVLNQNNIRLIDEFFHEVNVIMAEPMCNIFTRTQYEGLRQEFVTSGGLLISFEHYIDDASTKVIDRELMRIISSRYEKE